MKSDVCPTCGSQFKTKKGRPVEPEDYYTRAMDDLMEDLNGKSYVVEVVRTGVYSCKATCEDGTTMDYALQYQPKPPNK